MVLHLSQGALGSSSLFTLRFCLFHIGRLQRLASWLQWSLSLRVFFTRAGNIAELAAGGPRKGALPPRGLGSGEGSPRMTRMTRMGSEGRRTEDTETTRKSRSSELTSGAQVLFFCNAFDFLVKRDDSISVMLVIIKQVAEHNIGINPVHAFPSRMKAMPIAPVQQAFCLRSDVMLRMRSLLHMPDA